MQRCLCYVFFLGLLASAGLAQTKKQEPGFTERVDVNLRTIVAIVTDTGGRLLARPLSAEDVEVLEGGTPAQIISLEPAGGSTRRRAAAPSGPTTAESATVVGPAEIKRILYFDSSLLRRGSAQRVLDGVLKNLDSLLAGGPLEIVVADPDPKVLLAATRDATRCRGALRSSLAARLNRDRLQQIRIAFLKDESLMINKSGQVSGPARAAQVRAAMQEEVQVIRHSFGRLGEWASARVTRGPAILFLVIDGFDSDVSEFYRNWIDAAAALQLKQEFGYVGRKLVADISVLLASRGLLAIPIAAVAAEVTFTTDAATLGVRPHNDVRTQVSGPSPFLFARPIEPLSEIAETTGGEVATRPDRFGEVLDRLAGAVAITYRMERPPDGKTRKLSVRCLRPGVVLRAARSAVAGTADAAARTVEALEKPVPRGDLPVTASVEPLGTTSNNKRTAMLHVSVELVGLLESIRRAGPARFRVTVAFDDKEGSPTVHQQEFDVTRPGVGTVWRYDAELQGLPGGGRVAVTVEELTTGARGTALVDLPGAAGESGYPTGAPRKATPGGDEIPAAFEIVESTTRTSAKGAASVSAKLHVTVETETLLPAIARAGGWRLRLTVEAEGPNYRAVVAKSELSLPFDIAIDHWDFFVPMTWPANADRLLVTLQEPTSGPHASAVLELARQR
ncbi:MAG: hypothetical protein ACRD1P_04860 [Thermoanaerobaculia bacterium]